MPLPHLSPDEIEYLRTSRSQGRCSNGCLTTFLEEVMANKQYFEAFKWACIEGHDECLEIMINLGADVNRTVGIPLNLAAMEKHERCIRVLLKAGKHMQRPSVTFNNALEDHIAQFECNAEQIDENIAMLEMK